MPARGWHQDPQVQRRLRNIRGNGAPAPMPMGAAQMAMVRILSEVSDALEGGAGELRHLAHRVTPALTATPAESPHVERHA
jgi:hypothetical protein